VTTAPFGELAVHDHRTRPGGTGGPARYMTRPVVLPVVTDGDTNLAAGATEDLAVRVSDDGLVAWATLDRPEKRNALNENVLQGLLAVARAVDEGDQRVLVIRAAGAHAAADVGAADGSGEAGGSDEPGDAAGSDELEEADASDQSGGPTVFSAGGDFTEMPIGGTVQEYREGFTGLARVMRALREADALTVAAVEGPCLAGGLGLAATCEFLVASESATFATPEVSVGLFPVQAMVSITRTMPEKRALKLLFTGESIDAGEAHDLGLVTEVHPDGDFDAALQALVDDLAATSPAMIALGKETYYHQAGLSFERALAYAKEMIALVAMSEDTAEGIEARMMDRDPEWAGR